MFRHSPCLIPVTVILWQLCGSSSEFVCSIEKGPRGYLLLIQSLSTVIVNDVLPNIHYARWKADLIRSELLAMGYTTPA